jgi:hypothetical protein
MLPVHHPALVQCRYDQHISGFLIHLSIMPVLFFESMNYYILPCSVFHSQVQSAHTSPQISAIYWLRGDRHGKSRHSIEYTYGILVVHFLPTLLFSRLHIKKRY